MRAAVAGASFSLRHPRTGEVVGSASASALFERIARAAWQSGDPGLLFLDAIERANPLPAIAAIEATNPVNLANGIREQPAPARVQWRLDSLAQRSPLERTPLSHLARAGSSSAAVLVRAFSP